MFQVQSVYLIYAGLLVYAALILAYPKGHVYYIPLMLEQLGKNIEFVFQEKSKKIE